MLDWTKRDPLEHISAGIQALAKRGMPVSREEYVEMRMNSYERVFAAVHVYGMLDCHVSVLPDAVSNPPAPVQL